MDAKGKSCDSNLKYPRRLAKKCCCHIGDQASLLHHKRLCGKLAFVQFPQQPVERMRKVAPLDSNKRNMTRVFLGQMPYDLTSLRLDWLLETFCGVMVEMPEQIIREHRNRKQITGCYHAYVASPPCADTIIAALHKRVLFDNGGVWFAESEKEVDELADYCTTMKNDTELRPKRMPFDSVVVELAHNPYGLSPSVSSSGLSDTEQIP